MTLPFPNCLGSWLGRCLWSTKLVCILSLFSKESLSGSIPLSSYFAVTFGIVGSLILYWFNILYDYWGLN
jgi:hypothetical protein